LKLTIAKTPAHRNRVLSAKALVADHKSVAFLRLRVARRDPPVAEPRDRNKIASGP
jgi:hypothetical protein